MASSSRRYSIESSQSRKENKFENVGCRQSGKHAREQMICKQLTLGRMPRTAQCYYRV
jgi:hypothetical protein